MYIDNEYCDKVEKMIECGEYETALHLIDSAYQMGNYFAPDLGIRLPLLEERIKALI